MSVEMIHIPAEGPYKHIVRLLEVGVNGIAWMADCGTDPHELVFVTCSSEGVGLIYTAEAVGVDTSKEIIPLNPVEVGAFMAVAEDTKIEVPPGETKVKPYTDLYGNRTNLVVKSLGEHAITPMAN